MFDLNRRNELKNNLSHSQKPQVFFEKYVAFRHPVCGWSLVGLNNGLWINFSKELELKGIEKYIFDEYPYEIYDIWKTSKKSL